MKTQIDYTNWQGHRAVRTILPIKLFWGEVEFHPGKQWLLEAYDFDKDAVRYFAVKDINAWL